MTPHTSLAFVCLLIITICYIVVRVRRPFKTCRRCAGHGWKANPQSRRRGKPCQRCQGTGLRPKATHQAARKARRVHDDATR